MMRDFVSGSSWKETHVMDGKNCFSELKAKLGICNEMVQKYRLETNSTVSLSQFGPESKK